MISWQTALLGFLVVYVFSSCVDAGGFDRRWCPTYQEWCTPVAGAELEEWKDENQRISE